MTDTSGVFTDSSVRLPLPAEGSGTYEYLLNGEPSGITETFEVGSGGTQVRSERRTPEGVKLAAEVRISDEANAQVRLSVEGGDMPKVQVMYMLTVGQLRLRHMADGKFLDSEVDPGGDAVLSPLLRVFQGPTIADLIRADGAGTVVVPALDPTDPDSLLTPTFQARRTEMLGVEAADTASDHPGLRHCRYVGGNYDDAAEFWLDDQDRLVRYRFPQADDQLWDVTLETG